MKKLFILLFILLTLVACSEKSWDEMNIDEKAKAFSAMSIDEKRNKWRQMSPKEWSELRPKITVEAQQQAMYFTTEDNFKYTGEVRY